jgi:uncharacterized protein (DUF2062 family)
LNDSHHRLPDLVLSQAFHRRTIIPGYSYRSVSVMTRLSPESLKRNAAVLLQQGISPSRLALTLALGFAIGCIPLVGMPTVVCAALALALKLNLPAIQAANYAVMPLQLILIVPFMRLGGWLFASNPRQAVAVGDMLRLWPVNLSTNLIAQASVLAIHAMAAWLLVACPAVVLMTLTLTVLLRRIPALAAAKSHD